MKQINNFKTFRLWDPNLTIDLKSICLKDEWYYKLDRKKIIILLYMLLFSIIWVFNTILFLIR